LLSEGKNAVQQRFTHLYPAHTGQVANHAQQHFYTTLAQVFREQDRERQVFVFSTTNDMLIGRYGEI